MAYLIYKSDGTAVTIPDNAIDTAYYDASGGGGFGPGNIPQAGHGLGIQLVGRNTIGYGAAVAQSFLQLQENFCSSTVPNDAFALQGQLWFNQSSVTDGTLYVRTSAATSGGIANWKKLVLSDSSGNLVVSGTITASEFIGPATSIYNGSAGQIVYQTAPSVTGFITAPTVAGTYLSWNGTNFTWNSTTSGTVTSVGVSSNGTYAGSLTIGSSPVTSSGTITITPNVYTASTPGVVPGSGGGTTNFLRADGTWAATPNSGGTVTSIGVSSGNSAISVSGSPVTSSGTITVTANTFTSGAPGVVPASGGGSTNFLRADGTWTNPATGGTVTSVNVSGGSTGLTTSGGPVTTSGTITIGGTLGVGNGGTGATSFTAHGVLLGNSPVTSTAVGTTGQLLVGASGADPAWSSVALVTGSGVAVTGAITATGNITAFFSDRRLKENIAPITAAMDKVDTLHGITYTPNALAESFGYDRNEKIVGVFADEVKAVLPEAVKSAPFDTENGVSKSGENYMTVQYEKLVPLLIEAIKELNARIKTLEGK